MVEIDEHGRTSMWISNDLQQETMKVTPSLVLAVAEEVCIVNVVQSGGEQKEGAY